MKIRITFALFLAVFAAALASAQQVQIEKNPVTDSYVAKVTNEQGLAKYEIVKDPNSAVAQNDERMTGPWATVRQLGNKPWGKPASSFEEIRQDSVVRGHIDKDTDLSADQKLALKEALDDASLKYETIKAKEMPILAVFWGAGWYHYKVSLDLESKFAETEAYLFFVAKTNDWYVLFSYCRNLGQPLTSYGWEARGEEKTEQDITSSPKIASPFCKAYEPTAAHPNPLNVGTSVSYRAVFQNPNGVGFTFEHVLTNNQTGERQVLGVNTPDVAVRSDSAADFTLQLDGQYNGQPLEASACKVALTFKPVPVVTKTEPPPTPTPQIHKGGGCGKGCKIAIVAGVIAGGIGAAMAARGGQSAPAPEGSKPGIPTQSPAARPASHAIGFSVSFGH